jgi:hypothetical protein
VKRERDDLRYQLDQERDDRERRQQREREERDQQRAEMRRRANPSNRLYSGEVEDFTEATRLHAAACQQEITRPAPDDNEEMRKTIESCNRTMSESISQALRAQAIYYKITRETNERISEALRAEDLDVWAECLESGDYSRMAI